MDSQSTQGCDFLPQGKSTLDTSVMADSPILSHDGIARMYNNSHIIMCFSGILESRNLRVNVVRWKFSDDKKPRIIGSRNPRVNVVRR